MGTKRKWRGTHKFEVPLNRDTPLVSLRPYTRQEDPITTLATFLVSHRIHPAIPFPLAQSLFLLSTVRWFKGYPSWLSDDKSTNRCPFTCSFFSFCSILVRLKWESEWVNNKDVTRIQFHTEGFLFGRSVISLSSLYPYFYIIHGVSIYMSIFMYTKIDLRSNILVRRVAFMNNSRSLLRTFSYSVGYGNSSNSRRSHLLCWYVCCRSFRPDYSVDSFSKFWTPRRSFRSDFSVVNLIIFNLSFFYNSSQKLSMYPLIPHEESYSPSFKIRTGLVIRFKRRFILDDLTVTFYFNNGLTPPRTYGVNPPDTK